MAAADWFWGIALVTIAMLALIVVSQTVEMSAAARMGTLFGGLFGFIVGAAALSLLALYAYTTNQMEELRFSRLWRRV